MKQTITLQEFHRIDSLMQEQLCAGNFETCEDPRAYIKRESKLLALCTSVLGDEKVDCFETAVEAAAYLVSQGLLNQIDIVDDKVGAGLTPRERNLKIIETIAGKYGYTTEDILGPRRFKVLMEVRYECIKIFRQRGYSMTEIGRIMKRDHSSIIHALQKMAKMEKEA